MRLGGVGAAVLLIAVALACNGNDATSGGSRTATHTPILPQPLASDYDLTFAGSDGGLYIIRAGASGSAKFADLEHCREDGGTAQASLAWSPDGRRLACHAQQSSGNLQLVVFDNEGAEVAASSLPPNTSHITWSPSGEFLSYLAEPYMVILDGDLEERGNLGPTDIRPGNLASGVESLWAPNGYRLAYWESDAAELRVYDAVTRNERVVLEGNYRPLGWLTDDEVLVASGYEPPSEGHDASGYEVSVLDLRDRSIERFPELDAGPRSAEPGVRGQFWVAPGGEQIVAYTRLTGSPGGLAVVDRGGETTVIAGSNIGYPGEFIPRGQVWFSEDGLRLNWMNAQPVEFYSARLDGTDVRKLGEVDLHTARPSPDLRSVAFNMTSDGTVDLVVSDIDGGSRAVVATIESSGSIQAQLAIAWRPNPASQ